MVVPGPVPPVVAAVVVLSAHDDYHLAADSPFRGAGTLGSDVGADIDQIQAAVG